MDNDSSDDGTADASTILKGHTMTPTHMPNDHLLGGMGLPQDIQDLVINGVKSDSDAIALALALARMSDEQRRQADAFQSVLMRREIAEMRREATLDRRALNDLKKKHDAVMEGSGIACRPLALLTQEVRISARNTSIIWSSLIGLLSAALQYFLFKK